MGSRLHVSEFEHEGPDSERALHKHRDLPAVVGEPEKDLALARELIGEYQRSGF
jgi:hypothetical protein